MDRPLSHLLVGVGVVVIFPSDTEGLQTCGINEVEFLIGPVLDISRGGFRLHDTDVVASVDDLEA